MLLEQMLDTFAVPKVLWSEETLNGQAKICTLDKRSGYYLRIYRKDRKYSYPSLKTSDLEQARKNALEVYIETTNAPIKTRSKKYLLETAAEEYLREREEEVRCNELSQGSLNTYRQRLFQRILPYAFLKKVRNIGDLTSNTWDDYKKHHQQPQKVGRWGKESQGYSAETINSDITTIESFLKWCVHKGYLQPTEVPLKIKRVIQRKRHSQQSNPAFYPDEWRILVDVLRDWDTHDLDAARDGFAKEWRQEHFRLWLQWQYETGCRPHETDLLKFKDIEMLNDDRDEDDCPKKICIHIPENTKTGARDVIARWYLWEGILRHMRAGLSLLSKRNNEFNERMIARWENGIRRKTDKLKEEIFDFNPDPNDLLFFNVFNQKGERKNYSTTWYEEMWEELLGICMRDPKFPQDAIHKYTIYSLRSTHITHELLRGVDIEKVAENVGNSPPVIRERYRAPLARLNAKDLGNFEDTMSLYDDDDILPSISRS